MKRLFEKYRGDLNGLFWIFVSIFLGMALFSYSPQDPSLNSLVQNARPHNLCGYLGSFIADLFYQGFGVAAWVSVLASLRQGVLSFAGKKARKEKSHWLLDVLLLLCLTSLLSLHFATSYIFAKQIRLGGWVGYFLSKMLVRVLNEFGLGLVLWTCLAGLLVIYTDRGWEELLELPRKHLGQLLDSWRDSLLALFQQVRRVSPEIALQNAGGAISRDRKADCG
jgi:S-DNA-T family DNA segregation ATPase FtsK/SpoIIIE